MVHMYRQNGVAELLDKHPEIEKAYDARLDVKVKALTEPSPRAPYPYGMKGLKLRTTP